MVSGQYPGLCKDQQPKSPCKNHHNLNIPRYVNTFEEEQKIDIAAVAKQLKSLEKEMKNTDAELLAFCKELKIDTPF